MKQADTLVDEALRLPVKDRAKIAAELLASLDEGPDDDVEAAWAEELGRRVERMRGGEAVFEDWATVRDRLRRKQ
jgi:hypothetical protein